MLCIHFQEAYWLEQYSWALFKAMSHMLCIGYGRLVHTTPFYSGFTQQIVNE